MLASQNMSLAMAAMRDGIRSDAWQQYMTQFVEQNPPGKPVDPDQLARLTARDGTLGDQVLDRQRAYLVANAICGPSTVDTIRILVWRVLTYTMANVGHIARPALDCTTTVTDVTAARATSAKKAGTTKAAEKAVQQLISVRRSGTHVSGVLVH